MVFSSITFLFVFLPLFLMAYVLLPWKNLVALLFSLLFYAWGEGVYVFLLLLVVWFNYILGKIISKHEKSQKFLALGIVLNLLILSYFKYFGFLITDVIGLELSDEEIPHLLLGISFFIFQAISYLIDVSRNEAEPADSYFDLALYISMFPQLIAGPIVRYATVSEAIKHRSISVLNVTSGVRVFIIGLSYKMLIANNVAEVADNIFSLSTEGLSSLAAWLGAGTYTLQIYFDFAGYSLMAIGLGKVMGFEFPQNFNYPYSASSVTDFWRRWHISLSSWFRDYVYIPLGGNRHGAVRTYANLFIIFFLCGLWHGAAWTFVAWGMFHGFVLVVERAGLRSIIERIPRPLSMLYTMLLIIISWVLFRAENFSQAKDFLQIMFSFSSSEISYSEIMTNENTFFALIGIIISMPWASGKYDRLKLSLEQTSRNSILKLLTVGEFVLLLSLFLICSVYVISGSYNPFIYFRF